MHTAEANDTNNRIEPPMLPPEMWRTILSFLEKEGDCLSVIRFMGVCRLFRAIVHSSKKLVRVRTALFVSPPYDVAY
tara:strand:- start:630 stop:860 length:231 start_codon:yes stop_codon:yes gene_type:complete